MVDHNTPARIPIARRPLLNRNRLFDFLIKTPMREELVTKSGMILYLEDITVSFDGFRALNGLTLYVEAGELRCIIGPNGAGKTTLMDVITGKTRPDHGSAFYGQTVDLLQMSEPQIASLKEFWNRLDTARRRNLR